MGYGAFVWSMPGVVKDRSDTGLPLQVRNAEAHAELVKGLLEEKEIELCSARRQTAEVR